MNEKKFQLTFMKGHSHWLNLVTLSKLNLVEMSYVIL